VNSTKIVWASHVVGMGEIRNAYKILVGKPEGKRQLGRPGCRWEDNVTSRMDLKEVVREGVDESIWFRIETSGGALW